MEATMKSVFQPKQQFELHLPSHVQNVANAAERLWLTHQIKNKLESGMTLDEIVSEHLPFVDPQTQHTDCEDLKRGVQNLYASEANLINEDWIAQQIKQGLGKCTKIDDKARYLLNLLDLPTTVTVSEDAQQRLIALKNAAAFTEEDIAFMLDQVTNILYEDAGTLANSAVHAMLKSGLGKMDSKDVQALAGVGIDFSIAYAAASYIQQHQQQESVNGQNNLPAYDLGVKAAQSIEVSRFMELYYRGTITLDTLKFRVHQLFTAAVTLFKTHIVEWTAENCEIVATAFISAGLFVFFSMFLPLGPALIFLGSLCVAAKLTFIDIGHDYFVELAKSILDVAKSVLNVFVNIFRGVAKLFHSIFVPENQGCAVTVEQDNSAEAEATQSANAEASVEDEVSEDAEEDDELDEDDDELADEIDLY